MRQLQFKQSFKNSALPINPIIRIIKSDRFRKKVSIHSNYFEIERRKPRDYHEIALCGEGFGICRKSLSQWFFLSLQSQQMRLPCFFRRGAAPQLLVNLRPTFPSRQEPFPPKQQDPRFPILGIIHVKHELTFAGLSRE